MPTTSEPRFLNTPIIASSARASALLGAFVFALGCIGCGPPQVEPEHRELILMLATATSTQNTQLLDYASEEVEELQEAGSLEGAEEAEFLAIIASARKGDWEKARRRAYALRDAQRPTAADLERLKTRPLPAPKTLSQGTSSE